MTPRPAGPLCCPACGAPVAPSDETCPACGVSQGVERTTVRVAITPQPGELLGGKWRLAEKLGQGGMGTVWLAADVELERNVAVKMLAANLCDDAELVQRFEREARMMAKLDHPNLVPVYAVGRRQNTPFIVMKLLEGSTLGDYLREKVRLEHSEVLAIARQVCAGLAFVHERGVVHRDIKPANIFVAPDGHVTLLDMGVARDSQSNMTRSGVMVGTPRYMAPEQVLGKRVDHRADLYALATVIYEMATGQPVFDADSDFSVMKMHIDQAPRSPTEMVDIPEAMARALLKGLAKGPDERFQSAKELFAALEGASVRPPSQVETRADRSVLRPIPVTVPPRSPATPSSSRLGGSRAGLSSAAQPAEPPLSATLAAPRTNSGLWAMLGLLLLLAGGGGAYLASSGGREPAPVPLAAGGPKAGVAAGSATATGRETQGGEAVEPAPPAGEGGGTGGKAATTAYEGRAPEPAHGDDPRGAAEPVTAAGGGTEVEPTREVRPAVAPGSRNGGGETRVARAELRPTAKSGPAKVTCIATEKGDKYWAYVDVDGMRQGQTPLALSLEPGKHVLVFRREAYLQTRELTVSAGETKKLLVEMAR